MYVHFSLRRRKSINIIYKSELIYKSSRFLGLNHCFVYPRNKFLNIGVDAREMFSAAANAPGDKANENFASVHCCGEWATRVTLYIINGLLTLVQYYTHHTC